MKIRLSYSDRITDMAARASNDERRRKQEARLAKRACIQPELDELAMQATQAFEDGDEDRQRVIGQRIDALLKSCDE